MNNWQEWVGLLFIFIVGVLGWKFGYSQHNDMERGDSIHLPTSLRYLFGNPNPDGVYNIRGIYFQLFVLNFILPFVISDFGLISQYQAFQFLFWGMMIFPAVELIRYFAKKL